MDENDKQVVWIIAMFGATMCCHTPENAAKNADLIVEEYEKRFGGKNENADKKQT